MTNAETPEVGAGGASFGISVNPFSDQGGQIMPATLLLPPPPSFWTMRRLWDALQKPLKLYQI